MIKTHKAEANEIILLPHTCRLEGLEYDAIGIMEGGICILDKKYYAIENEKGEFKTLAELIEREHKV